MPTLVNANGWDAGAESTAGATPYDQLVTEEAPRSRADSKPRPEPKHFSVVAVDETRTGALPRIGGSAFPAEAPPLVSERDVRVHFDVGGSVMANSTAKQANNKTTNLAAKNGDQSDGATTRDPDIEVAVGQPQDRSSDTTAPGDRRSGAPQQPLLPLPAETSSSAGGPIQSLNGIDDDAVSATDEQASLSGVHHRVHYRKLREKVASAPDAEQSSGAPPAKMDRLSVPAVQSLSYHSSLSGNAPWNYPALLGGASPSHRNISTLSLTLLLRDQRRKNLAMLARLFASRQKEKDLLDGAAGAHGQYQDTATESKRKRCKVTSMQVAVASLFCTLVALVATSVLMFAPNRGIYRSQPEFIFEKDSRLLTVRGSNGGQVLQIRTGTDLRGLPYNCSTPDDLRSRRRCWKWSPSNVTLRVGVATTTSDITCVDVSWTTTSIDTVLRDCITLGAASWYGGSNSRLLPWSLSAAAASMEDGLGPVLYAPCQELGTLTARSWLTTSGSLVSARASAPLYFTLEGSGSATPSFCLSSWYGLEQGSVQQLNYTACVGDSVPSVHEQLVASRRKETAVDLAPGGPNDTEDEPWQSNIVVSDPVWVVDAANGADILQQVVTKRFATGTFVVKSSALLDTAEVTNALSNIASAAAMHNVAVKFGITLSFLVSVKADLFLQNANDDLWVTTAQSSLPVLLRDGSGSVSVSVNVSSPLGAELIQDRVAVVAQNYTLSLLLLQSTIATGDLALEAHTLAAQERLLTYPQHHARLGMHLSSTLLSGAPVIVDSATNGLAGYVLPEAVRRSSLADIVTHVLAASVAGDPPASIGPFDSVEVAGMSSRDKYIRWMQLASFMPVMVFDRPPWFYNDKEVVDIAQDVIRFRHSEIVPRLRRLYDAHRHNGSPVYKPLWWNDTAAAAAKTSKLSMQFFLDDLLVAPVLDQKPFRLIYFPSGFWLDQDQRLFIGSGVHNYTVTLRTMPYFVRKTTGIHEKGIPESDIQSNNWR